MDLLGSKRSVMTSRLRHNANVIFRVAISRRNLLGISLIYENSSYSLNTMLSICLQGK